MKDNVEEGIYEKVMRGHRNKNKELPVPLHELDTIKKSLIY